ncbi:MAG: GNAT family N-acetyltransferase, partial [Myxococcota bacterium]|nr:GNAT family N-acetyltransferase [Myxococcota bacterium]
AWRGRGVGARLLGEAARRARADGVAQLTLRVAVSCRSAIRLYEREGFAVFGREPRALRDASGDEDELHMVRPLDGPAG